MVERHGVARQRLTLQVSIGRDAVDHFLDKGARGLDRRDIVHVTEIFGISASFVLNAAMVPSGGGCSVSRLKLSIRTTGGLCAKGIGGSMIGHLLRGPHFTVIACVVTRCVSSALTEKCTTRGRVFTAINSLLLKRGRTPRTMRTTQATGTVGVPTCRTSRAAVRGAFVAIIGRVGGRTNDSLITTGTVDGRTARGVFTRLAGKRSVRGPAVAPRTIISTVANDVSNISKIGRRTLSGFGGTLLKLVRAVILPRSSKRSGWQTTLCYNTRQ